MKTAVREGIEDFWHREHPGEPVTEPVREQIAVSTAAVLHIGSPLTPGGPFYGPTGGAPPGMPPGGTVK